MLRFNQREHIVKEMIYTYMKHFGIEWFEDLFNQVKEKILKEKNFHAEIEEYDGE
jgi:hypothetical protein